MPVNSNFVEETEKPRDSFCHRTLLKISFFTLDQLFKCMNLTAWPFIIRTELFQSLSGTYRFNFANSIY